jgi:hypothetical protein
MAHQRGPRPAKRQHAGEHCGRPEWDARGLRQNRLVAPHDGELCGRSASGARASRAAWQNGSGRMTFKIGALWSYFVGEN